MQGNGNDLSRKLSWLWFLVGLLSIFCGVIWGGLSDKLGRGMGRGAGIYRSCHFLRDLAILQFKAGFYLSAVFFGLTAWSIPTIMAATAGDYVGPQTGPGRPGIYHAILWNRTGVGAWIGGYLADITKSFQGPFLLAVGVSVLGAILSLRLRRIHTED